MGNTESREMSSSSLFHLVPSPLWQAACQIGTYRPESLKSEGFIHFSFAHQWRLSQQRYYPDQPDILLLEIDPSGWGDELRIENGFPHLYGPMPCSAVRSSRHLAAAGDLKVGLFSALNPAADDLREAHQQGCKLVILPELPFHRWCPAHPERHPQDEDLGRAERQAQLAREAGLWLLGGSLLNRRNTALLWDDQGRERMRCEKLHLPQEPGFWEADHFEPGQHGPEVCDALGFPLGIQICSDIQRPFGSMSLRYQGASAILVPRATEQTTFKPWRLVMQAMARMTACYVLSVNRPGPEMEVNLGGPSLVVGPDGEVLEESTESLVCAKLSREAIVRARSEYPGYLEVRGSLYARAWENLA